VRKHFAKRPLRRRVVALVAAYAIALSSLIATFGGARAAAETAGIAGSIICHTLAGSEAPSPSGGQSNRNVCANNCCTGCLMLMTALPPPPATVAGAPQSAGQLLLPPTKFVFAASYDAKSHRSRAPPLTA
jgi:hypothetical protein